MQYQLVQPESIEATLARMFAHFGVRLDPDRVVFGPSTCAYQDLFDGYTYRFGYRLPGPVERVLPLVRCRRPALMSIAALECAVSQQVSASPETVTAFVAAGLGEPAGVPTPPADAPAYTPPPAGVPPSGRLSIDDMMKPEYLDGILHQAKRGLRALSASPQALVAELEGREAEIARLTARIVELESQR